MNIQPTESSLTWHLLNALTQGDEITELMAAASDDGIGVIAEWKRAPNGSWTVEAMDTEGGGDWSPISEEETGIPPEPPFELSKRITDAERLNHLEQTIKACPHTEIYHDEMDEDEPWVMEVEGCELIHFRATTLRELIDQSIAFDASGEDFEVWQAQKEENS